MMSIPSEALSVEIKGLVQGVGFRPFVYRCALECRITGWVNNTNKGVEIHAEGNGEDLERFLLLLQTSYPPAARPESLSKSNVKIEYYDTFEIIPSRSVPDAITAISPDIAVCQACLEDMKQQPHRFRYPFVNCTHCGPRYSIIRDLPYDREKTSMAGFAMCEKCMQEYHDISDRRFHAQPVACNDCGPEYSLLAGKSIMTGHIDELLRKVSDILQEGGIVAIKGMGGYHLACDAFNDHAVSRLRELKRRDGKPFALMFRDIAAIRSYARVSAEEESLLESWIRPVVILDPVEAANNFNWSHACQNGLKTIGAFLPYMPVHYLIFELFKNPCLVMTSGNLSSDPVIISDDQAFSEFGELVEAVLFNNREIVHRTDDSVVRVIDGHVSVFRRSRGYVPTPFKTDAETEGILALGAELSSAFCIGKDQQAIMSPYVGDLKSAPLMDCFDQTLTEYFRLFRFQPQIIACDLHPLYHSTRKASAFQSLPVIATVHHHAHVVACMGEHGLNGKVIGVAFDGTGLGEDGRIRGAELMIADRLSFKRFSQFGFFPLPGGDKAVEEPWRTAIGYLYPVFGNDLSAMQLPLLQYSGKERTSMLFHMIDQGINCPMVSSAGRLFDAVAAITGLCMVNTFQAEAPMRLESIINPKCREEYPFHTGWEIDLKPMILAITRDVMQMTSTDIISARFHNTIISIIFESVKKAGLHYGINEVVLTGGVFQNRYLSEGVSDRLRRDGMKVYLHGQVPANDGGIAFGQLLIAAERRKQQCV